MKTFPKHGHRASSVTHRTDVSEDVEAPFLSRGAPHAESSPAPASSMTRKVDGVVGDGVQDDGKSRAHASGGRISRRYALEPTRKKIPEVRLPGNMQSLGAYPRSERCWLARRRVFGCQGGRSGHQKQPGWK